MIIAQLMGGLGNQMFQYSIGRHLAILNGTSLKLDLTMLQERPYESNYTLRNFELNHFNLNAQIANKKDISMFLPGNSIFKMYIAKIRRKVGLVYVKNESGFGFQKEIFSSGKNVYLKGYWQSEKYFSPINQTIRNDFTIENSFLNKIVCSEKIIGIINKITQTNSIAIHFRRGDYVKNPLIHKHHGICSPDYYLKAISFIKKRVELPHFFLFCDEPDWLRTDFVMNEPFTIIENNSGFVDLYLMSLCKHNIIANSSFSWWGAWLNSNTGKIVVAPQKWFADPEINKQTIDLIPAEWVRL